MAKPILEPQHDWLPPLGSTLSRSTGQRGGVPSVGKPGQRFARLLDAAVQGSRRRKAIDVGVRCEITVCVPRQFLHAFSQITGDRLDDCHRLSLSVYDGLACQRGVNDGAEPILHSHVTPLILVLEDAEPSAKAKLAAPSGVVCVCDPQPLLRCQAGIVLQPLSKGAVGDARQRGDLLGGERLGAFTQRLELALHVGGDLRAFAFATVRSGVPVEMMMWVLYQPRGRRSFGELLQNRAARLRGLCGDSTSCPSLFFL